MANIKILVATHKKYSMPKDKMYVPIHVGREGKEDLGYIGDNTGDNISVKNGSWSELTGLYWGWKNLKCDYIGLVQYRRHLKMKRKKNLFTNILNSQEAELLIGKADIILPPKRKYWIVTLEEHFDGYDFSIESDMRNFRRAVNKISPEYSSDVNKVLKQKSGHMCNMFLMKKELADEFCAWEFAVLDEFEKYISPERKRIIGYIAEHMLDIWISKNNYKYIECGLLLLDKKNEIDKKIDFVSRKLKLNARRIKLE